MTQEIFGTHSKRCQPCALLTRALHGRANSFSIDRGSLRLHRCNSHPPPNRRLHTRLIQAKESPVSGGIALFSFLAGGCMRLGCAVMALALLLGAVPVVAQTRTISGTVTDAETGQPLEGARVSVRGTALSTT